MSDWDRFAAGHGPSEERGQAPWSVWSTAETQTSLTAPAWVSPPAPTPVPTPVLAPASGRRAWRLVLAVALAVVLGAGAGGGVWYVTHGRAKVGAAESAGVARSASAYRTAEDPAGYTVDVPRGWTRTQRQGAKAPVVTYGSPDGTRRLQIFRVSEDSPAESLDLAENDPGYGFARQSGYRVIDRATGPSWAELTYRYDGGRGEGARRVIDRRFEAAGGSLYAVRSSGPESLDPALVRGPLTAAVDSFCPAGANCR